MSALDKIAYFLNVVCIVGIVLTLACGIVTSREWLETNHVRLRVQFQNWLESRRNRRARRRLRKDVIKHAPSPICDRRNYVP